MKTPNTSINILDIGTKEVEGWSRYIYFSYNDKEYEVTLSFDSMSGYDLYFAQGDQDELEDAMVAAGELEDRWDLPSILDDLTWEGRNK